MTIPARSVLPPDWSAFAAPIMAAIDAGHSRISLVGLVGSSKALVLSLLARQFMNARSLLMVAATSEAAEELRADLLFYHQLLGMPSARVSLFPEWGQLPYASNTPPVEVIGTRMLVLDALTQTRDGMTVITSVPAFLQRLVPRTVLAEACFSLRLGDSIARPDFIGRLLRLGYRQVSAVESPGEFAMRGGIADLFSAGSQSPHRIEFLGDTVETLRPFDPATQKSSGRSSELPVLPARELLRSGTLATAPLEPDAEWRGPYEYGTMDTLLDYFSHPTILIADEPLELKKQAQEFLAEAQAAYDGLQGARELSPPSDLFLPLGDLLGAGGAHCVITVEAIGIGSADSIPGTDLFRFESQRPQAIGIGVKGRPFHDTISHLEALRAKGPVAIVARSRGQVDRLRSLFAEHDLPAEPLRGQSITAVKSLGPYALIDGQVSGGLIKVAGAWPGGELPQVSVITEDELFAKGTRHKVPTGAKGGAFLKSIEELKIGDYVVHVLHGVGRYVGLQRLPVQGYDSDYLIVEYAGGDKVYVPLDRLKQVQRYFGSGEQTPKLDRLGGKSWERTKSRVRKGIEDMAKELITVQATREVRGRPPFAEDSVLSHEFDAAFEYEETEDQLRAIEDVKRDMDSDKPMDRLVCGDVGYGKTEVAMRAVFKAVLDNMQAAIVVPTTLLAQQHFDTFSERFAAFPVRVGVLSRFQGPKEQKSTLRGLADGSLDIVIGTHRLLQKDVGFRNLGLIVIDEEQWFGVQHKERLKQLRAQVDVLTLTATPIPRTLQMAMSGLRDLSVIETPPADRLAIRTQVVRFGKSVIREAIIHELSRGGQVFFVHNRVQSIERMGSYLRELVPEARIVVAHGQMDSRLVESVMLKFHRHEADVLLSTAIIESGLDIPNANTILVDHADSFGLAQLYQLRGRVGRGSHQAYAYFMVSGDETLTTEAQQRLQAIQDFTALGSGFRIAAADMEIRGGGNLLGREQSGHIGAVGFELYMQMLEQAVRELKGQEVVEEIEPELQLRVSAYIPDSYVEDAAQRLSLYKRLSSSKQLGDLAQLHGEIVDRYGAVPDSVERLFEVMEIRLLAKTARILAVSVNPHALSFRFDPQAPPPQPAVRALMDQYRTKLRFTSPNTFQIAAGDLEWKAVFQELKRVLQVLGAYDKNPPTTAMTAR